MINCIVLCSDIRAKAKRWDQKHVDSLKRRRDQYLNEIKELNKDRRKEGDLSVMKSQIDGLETRLKFAKKDKETTVYCFFFHFISRVELIE